MLGTQKFITLEAARKMAEAGEEEAKRNNRAVAIAVVDAGMNLVLFHKMDGVQTASIEVAIGKAKTAAGFKRPTKALEDMITGGRTPFLAVPGIVPVQGGLPVTVDGEVIGGVGASGLTSPEDEQVVEAALKALS